MSYPSIQRNSFTSFLKKGLIEELRRVENFTFPDLKINFQVNKLKYKKPRFSAEVCLRKNLTYSIGLYVPITIKSAQSVLLK